MSRYIAKNSTNANIEAREDAWHMQPNEPVVTKHNSNKILSFEHAKKCLLS